MFLQSFPDSILGFIFIVFLVAPVLELVGLIFDIKNRVEKGRAGVREYTRVYASTREYWVGESP